MQSTLRHVLRHADPVLIAQLFEQHGLACAASPEALTPARARIAFFINSLDEAGLQQSRALRLQIEDIGFVASELGVKALLQAAGRKHDGLKRAFAGLATHADRALHTLLEEPDIFERGVMTMMTDRATGRARRLSVFAFPGGRAFSPSPDLERALRELIARHDIDPTHVQVRVEADKPMAWVAVHHYGAPIAKSMITEAGELERSIVRPTRKVAIEIDCRSCSMTVVTDKQCAELRAALAEAVGVYGLGLHPQQTLSLVAPPRFDINRILSPAPFPNAPILGIEVRVKSVTVAQSDGSLRTWSGKGRIPVCQKQKAIAEIEALGLSGRQLVAAALWVRFPQSAYRGPRTKLVQFRQDGSVLIDPFDIEALEILQHLLTFWGFRRLDRPCVSR